MMLNVDYMYSKPYNSGIIAIYSHYITHGNALIVTSPITNKEIEFQYESSISDNVWTKSSAEYDFYRIRLEEKLHVKLKKVSIYRSSDNEFKLYVFS